MVTRLKDAVDPFHWPEFIQSNVDFAINTVQEAQDREASKNVLATRCTASYMVMRRETVGTRPCIILMRSIQRLYLPENVMQNPVVAEMENTALDMVLFANVCLVYLEALPMMLTDISIALGPLFLQKGTRRKRSAEQHPYRYSEGPDYSAS